MSKESGIKKEGFDLNDSQLSVAKNVFSLFQKKNPKRMNVKEDEDAIRVYEDTHLVNETQKQNPLPRPLESPPRNNANSALFTSMETLEKTAKNMLSGFMTPNQIELLPEAVRNFVVLNPGFIRNLMNAHGLIAQHLFLLNYNELMVLHQYRENLEKLLDTGISMQQLLSLSDMKRSIFIYNADAIVSLIKQGNSFEQLSQLSNNDLMCCIQEKRASEASQSSSSVAQWPS